MDHNRLAQVERLFHEAKRRPPDERAQFLDEASGGDAALRAEVQALLDTPASAAGFMESPAAAQFGSTADLTGRRLGVYAVGERIGAGGMGEVYQARDTKLGREVALKVLPAVFAGDRERLARFQREARVLASLNHPNVAQIHGLEEGDGITALVMELVSGPTLADRITQGSIPIDEAVPIARQIVDALEAAHEQGIVHRDLKPANVKVRDDGTVKVLDFGLAKAMGPAEGSSPNLSQSPTITTPATLPGTVLGTAAYMAPEQAKGQVVDKRADIWAFGAVLYEMLTGHRAFEGGNVAEVIAGVIRAEPRWDALPVDLPPVLGQYLRRCLQKDPRQRIHDIADVRLALEGAFDLPVPPAVSTSAPTLPGWRRVVPLALAALAGSVMAGVGVRAWLGSAPPPLVKRFSVTLPESDDLRQGAGLLLALSPDGRTLVYRAARDGVMHLFRRPMDEFEGLLGPVDLVGSPFFSPDGRWLAFHANGALQKVSLAGGPPQTLVTIPGIQGGSWGPSGEIVVGLQTNGALLRVPEAGGEATPLFSPDDRRRSWYPQVLPGGEVLFTSVSAGAADSGELHLLKPSGEDQTILPNATAGRLLGTGHLVFIRGGSLWAVPFDRDRLDPVGTPVPVVEGVRVESGGAVQVAIADDGTLAYIPAVVQQKRGLFWESDDGREQAVATPAGAFDAVVLSPDGRRAALVIKSGNLNTDVWVTELARGTLTQITYDGSARDPLWTPDGQALVYGATRDGRAELLKKAADGTGAPETLATFDADVYRVGPESWAPDGVTLQIGLSHRNTGFDIGLISPDAAGTWRVLIQTPFDELDGQISPDGRWIAYMSNDSGGSQVYVQRFPGLGDRQPVSPGQDRNVKPRWAPDGRALFYRRGSGERAIMRVPFVTNPATGEAVIGVAVPVLDWRFWVSQDTQRVWAIAPDGHRFLVIKEISEANAVPQPSRQINVVLNWLEDLERRVPTK